MVQIRKMERSDIPVVFDLIDRERWGWEQRHIERILARDEENSMVSCSNGEINGVLTAVRYGDTALIAHLVVQDARRGSGLGPRLLSEALESLFSNDVERIELFSNLDVVDFYEKHGFSQVQELTFCTLEADEVRDNSNLHGSVSQLVKETLTPDEMRSIANMEEILGYESEPMLRVLKKDPPDISSLMIKDNEMLGFLLGYSVGKYTDLGPCIVAPSEVQLTGSMLSSMISALPGHKFDIIVSSDNSQAMNLMLEFGFKPNDRVVRMTISDSKPKPYPSNVISPPIF